MLLFVFVNLHPRIVFPLLIRERERERGREILICKTLMVRDQTCDPSAHRVDALTT